MIMPCLSLGDGIIIPQAVSEFIIMENKMETTVVCYGVVYKNGKQNGNYYSILWGYVIMENKMETTFRFLGARLLRA